MTTANPISKRERWLRRILTVQVTFIFVASAVTKLAGVPKVIDNLTRAGIPASAIPAIAILELSCLALFLFPRTTPVGMLLLTGYLGGATLTHLIAGEMLVPPLFVGALVWAGAYLRVPEFRSLLPLRKTESPEAYSRTPAQQALPSRG
jgi:uncharacterized membrane protein YphA (DoxX/SURF4 family)